MGQSTGRVTAVAGVEHDRAAGQAVPGAAHQLALAQRVRRAAGDGPAEVGEGAQRLRAHEPVGREAHAALEAAHGLLGVGAEEAVHPLRAEPEGEQPLLQRGHVVALQQVPRSV